MSQICAGSADMRYFDIRRHALRLIHTQSYETNSRIIKENSRWSEPDCSVLIGELSYIVITLAAQDADLDQVD